MYFPSKKEIALASIFVFYYIKRFRTGIDKDNGILMSLFLLVAVTAILFMKNSLVFKADIPPTMLSSNYLIKFSTLLRKETAKNSQTSNDFNSVSKKYHKYH